jgi:two-component system sensor histidine kinase UhpB
VVFQLRDNGVGFDKIQALSREVSQKSLGLTAMKERALMANGTLDIWSRRGKGTQVTFTIPIDK